LRDARPRFFVKVALVLVIVFCLGGVVGAVVSPFRAVKEPVAAVDMAPAAAPMARLRKLPMTSLPATPVPSEPLSDQLACFLGEAAPVRAEAAAVLKGAAGEACLGCVLGETPPGLAEPKLLPDQPKLILEQPKCSPEQPRLPTPAGHRAGPVAMLSQPAPPSALGRPAEIASPPIAPSPIAAEKALLGRAMTTLRAGRDAGTALALLAQHAEIFPNGAFTSEATALRIEALLALGRRDEALSVLDKAPLAALPDHDERLVVRGELRAANERWREAEQDFNDVLQDRHLLAESARARNVQERALWGRAVARGRRGDKTGARADLELYLRIFPTGRFARDAGALLEEKR
jgi:hypothetical protein